MQLFIDEAVKRFNLRKQGAMSKMKFDIIGCFDKATSYKELIK